MKLIHTSKYTYLYSEKSQKGSEIWKHVVNSYSFLELGHVEDLFFAFFAILACKKEKIAKCKNSLTNTDFLSKQSV